MPAAGTRSRLDRSDHSAPRPAQSRRADTGSSTSLRRKGTWPVPASSNAAVRKTLLSFSIPPGPGRPQSLGLLTIRRLGSGGSCCLRRRRAISRAGRFTLRLRICRVFKTLPFRPQGRPSRRVLGGFKMVVSNTKMACLQSGRGPRTQARLIVSAHR